MLNRKVALKASIGPIKLLSCWVLLLWLSFAYFGGIVVASGTLVLFCVAGAAGNHIAAPIGSLDHAKYYKRMILHRSLHDFRRPLSITFYSCFI